MEPKFTKSPWLVYRESDGFGSQDWDEIIVGMGTYNESPSCYESHHKVSVSAEPEDEEGIANANLIAAAPDMYQVLQLLLNAEGVITQPQNRRIIKQLLAKARGEKGE